MVLKRRTALHNFVVSTPKLLPTNSGQLWYYNYNYNSIQKVIKPIDFHRDRYHLPCDYTFLRQKWIFGIDVTVRKMHVTGPSTHIRVAVSIHYVFIYKFRHNFEASGYRVCAFSPSFRRINDISFIIFINLYNPIYEPFIIMTARYKFSHSRHVVVVACFITTHISTKGLYF